MRIRKQKRHRKIVRFYKACFGFREPFKVLCDGTFITHLLVNGLLPADVSLSNLLGGSAALFASRCIIAELKSLGNGFSDSIRAAHDLPLARCDHAAGRKRAADCIHDILGESNSEHYLVATQDSDLRKILGEMPGVPVIYGLRTALFLEPPSTCDRQYVKSVEDNCLHLTDLELKLLSKNRPTFASRTSVLDASHKAIFKRKKAKGPNPLSCLKKKNKACSSISNKDGAAAGILKRRRRKTRVLAANKDKGNAT